MEWYYAEANQQRGPVGESEFQRLVDGGTIRDDTLVWRDGMANWLPYRDTRSPAPASPALTPTTASVNGGIICAQCGKAFAPDDVIRLGEAWVCAECKPVFIQRLREGAEVTPQRSGMVSEAELLARDYDIRIDSYFQRAWHLFKVSPGALIGASLLVYLPLLVINFIPYLSMVLALVLTGPLVGGLWLLYIGRVRGREAGVAEAFSGFGPRFVPLVLTSIVSTVLSYLCLLPGGVLFIGGTLAARSARAGGSSAMSTGLMVSATLLLIVGVLALIYFTVSWIFAFPLVADKRLGFWNALGLSRRVIGKHWWGTLLLFIVVCLLGGAGVLACGVGALITGPVSFMMFALHYERVFGDLLPQGPSGL